MPCFLFCELLSLWKYWISIVAAYSYAIHFVPLHSGCWRGILSVFPTDLPYGWEQETDEKGQIVYVE